MYTICGRILVAMSLLCALAGCAGMGTESTPVAPTSAPVYPYPCGFVAREI
jgi:hypothetical protein